MPRGATAGAPHSHVYTLQLHIPWRRFGCHKVFVRRGNSSVCKCTIVVRVVSVMTRIITRNHRVNSTSSRRRPVFVGVAAGLGNDGVVRTLARRRAAPRSQVRASQHLGFVAQGAGRREGLGGSGCGLLSARATAEPSAGAAAAAAVAGYPAGAGLLAARRCRPGPGAGRRLSCCLVSATREGEREQGEATQAATVGVVA